MQFNFIQTFYIDSQAVANASQILLTAVELFFKSVPRSNKNSTGIREPGVSVFIVDVENNSPVPTKAYKSIARREYKSIGPSSDASIRTPFVFNSPISLKTNRFYGIAIKYDDPNFELWTNKQGNALVGTNIASTGAHSFKDGALFQSTNSSTFLALNDTDLKFSVKIAKYTSNNTSLEMVNDNYEFLTINSRTGGFVGGENVFANVANANGTISVVPSSKRLVGNNTVFTNLQTGNKIVLYAGSQHQVLEVDVVANNTYLTVKERPIVSTEGDFTATYKVAPIGRVFYDDTIQKTLILDQSNANTTVKFTANTLLIGETSNTSANLVSVNVYSVDKFIAKIGTEVPPSSRITLTHSYAYSNGSAYLYANTNERELQINKINEIVNYDAYLISKSLEADNSNLFSDNRKSSRLIVNLAVSNTTASFYEAPVLQKDEIDFLTIRNGISNVHTTTVNSIVIDTEVTNQNLAQSRYISKKVNFANNSFAEDIRVFITAYRPANTNILVYAKIHNSNDPEPFDDKQWTPLSYVTGGETFSSSENRDDIIEYELGFSNFPESAYRLAGSFTTQSANAVILATTNPTSNVAVNDVVKIYNPLIPLNYQVAVVTAANSTSITIGDTVSNNNIVGAGFNVDVVKYKNVGFNNQLNDGIVRYYNEGLGEYDKYSSMQIKIVLLSDTTFKTPYVEQLQVIGVSV